ncbi:hypothetical protein WICPIJ_004187 [Wickerhamomyces pijperi]|uniref:Association with the SNF1 complex (ASC) domain-containing protein n=1 Tax=Wickerhamomyces pijperi TaxID=599730 RepID=A0A9P8Q8G4_WICPI|nr:hypothetical protein WICPIJ_004187 [Wickerhamomyces pijperi]
MGNVTSQNQPSIHNSKRNKDDINPAQANTDQIRHPLLSPVNSKATASVSMAHNNIKYNDSLQDVAMSGTSSANLQEQELQALPKRKSTMILTDEHDLSTSQNQSSEYSGSGYSSQYGTDSTNEQIHQSNSNDSSNNNNSSVGSADQQQRAQPEAVAKMAVEINWLQGGENVFITGSFTGWRKMIRLNRGADGKFSIKLKLPVGTHRFRFIVDNELRFSDHLPTATDQMGNFVNYIEVTLPAEPYLPQEEQNDQNINKGDVSNKPNNEIPNAAQYANQANQGEVDFKEVDDDDMGNGYSRFHEEQNAFKEKYSYDREIPKIFVDPTVMEQYYNTVDNGTSQQNSWLVPPQLPPHLENVILNNFQTNDKNNNSGALPIPNHVVLNHLATTSIKHNTLAVASVVRYKRKYVTQVLYAPLQ